MEIAEPFIRHVWDGRWEPQPEPNQHISIMYLDQVMTVMKMRIPLTSSSLRAKQVILVLLLALDSLFVYLIITANMLLPYIDLFVCLKVVIIHKRIQ